MVKVGLTGGIGAGKSTVGTMFAEFGCKVLDSDLITRTLFQPGQAVNRAVADAFGPTVLSPGGSIDRVALGGIVFGSRELLQKLNSLVHPAIRQHQVEFLDAVAAKDPDGIGIVEAALMIEVGSYKNYDKVIVVRCTPEFQRRRLKERGSLTDEQIEARIASQMPVEEKVKYADYVIDNSSDREATRRQVAEVYRELTRIASRPFPRT